MRRKRVTGRFYVFVALLMIAMFFILRELFPGGATEAMVTEASAAYSRAVQAVIVRDEEVVGFEGVGRIEYVAGEGSMLAQGDEVCDVYTSGYSETELTKLETIRKSIRSYHEQLLDDIKEDELDRLEQRVESVALQLKMLVKNKQGGSLLNVKTQLEEAMVARQNYLRQNRRGEDPKLIDLYDQETKRLNAIEPWKTVATAPRAGMVSFYLDGYENLLTIGKLDSITFDEVRDVLAGRNQDLSAASRLETNVFRIVSTDKWYVILLSNEPDWNPVSGQVITFMMDGFPDTQYTGTVVRAQKSGSEVMAQLEVVGSLGPLMAQRKGSAQIGAQLSGLSVPTRALTNQSGQDGVLVNDGLGGSFIPVEVLAQNGNLSIIRPIVDGTLSVGQPILIK